MQTGTLSLPSLEELKPFLPGTTLGAAAIDLSLVKAQVKAPFTLAPGTDLTLDVSTGAELRMRALNESSPDDPDRIVARAGTRTPAGELPPQVQLTDDHAWLKYRIDAQANVRASAAAGWFGVAAGTSRDVACCDYRRHPKDTFTLAAVERDIAAGPRFAVSLDHVRSLGVGDAVSLEVSGELFASVTLSWSDVFTSQLGTLTRAIKATSPIALETSVGATITSSVKLADTFVLVFSKPEPSHVRVGLRKGAVRTVDFGAEAGVSVEIDNPEEITRVLDGVLGNLLGEGYGQVKALAGRAGLDEADLQRFGDVFERLGLPSVPTLDTLKDALDSFERDVKSRIETLLKEKVSLSFAYEYRRIAADAMLFQALLSADALEAHHRALARGSLQTVLAAALAQPGTTDTAIAVESYANEKTVQASRAIGFTLGIGKWTLAGKDRDELAKVRRLSLDGQHEQRSYTGLGSYSGNVFGEKKTWHVDFVAEMPRFSVGPVPRLQEYQLGVAVTYEESNRSFDDGDIEQAIDIAILWSICAPHDAHTLRALLAPARDRENVAWTANIRINDEACRAILPVIAASGRAQFAGPMAAAMRAFGGLGIGDVARRRALYTPIWASYLAAEEPRPRDMAAVAEHRLRHEEPTLARLERDFQTSGADRLVTAAGTCDLNPRTPAQADDFIRGARLIADAARRNDPDLDVLATAYKRMRNLWNQSHHVRALGARVIDAAAEAGVLKGVERTLTVVADGASTTIGSNSKSTT